MPNTLGYSFGSTRLGGSPAIGVDCHRRIFDEIAPQVVVWQRSPFRIVQPVCDAVCCASPRTNLVARRDALTILTGALPAVRPRTGVIGLAVLGRADPGHGPKPCQPLPESPSPRGQPLGMSSTALTRLAALLFRPFAPRWKSTLVIRLPEESPFEYSGYVVDQRHPVGSGRLMQCPVRVPAQHVLPAPRIREGHLTTPAHDVDFSLRNAWSKM